MRNKIAGTLLIASLWAIAPPLAAKDSGTCEAARLSTSVNAFLAARFQGWRPKTLGDMDADNQRLWEKAHPDMCPGIAIGHFESTDVTSFAILLVPAKNPSGGYKLVVLKPLRSDNYAVRVLDHADTQAYDGLVITTADPGKYSDFSGTQSVTLKVNAVYLEWIEKGAQLFYFANGRYHKLQVSD